MNLGPFLQSAGNWSRCVLALSLLAVVGCSGRGPKGPGSDKPGVTRRDNKMAHSPCDVTGQGAKGINVGGDAKADMVMVRYGGREVCRALDLNFDGVVDAWVYYDAQGKVSRRENDYDRDGNTDEIILYLGGVTVEKRRATAMVGRIDTWHFYRFGKLSKTERDADGDAIIDQWWEYPKPDHPECPLIHADTNGDGRPDPGASVAVCDEPGYVPPERTKEQKSVFDQRDESVPTEVEEKSNEPAPEAKPRAPAGPAGKGK